MGPDKGRGDGRRLPGGHGRRSRATKPAGSRGRGLMGTRSGDPRWRHRPPAGPFPLRRPAGVYRPAAGMFDFDFPADESPGPLLLAAGQRGFPSFRAEALHAGLADDHLGPRSGFHRGGGPTFLSFRQALSAGCGDLGPGGRGCRPPLVIRVRLSRKASRGGRGVPAGRWLIRLPRSNVGGPVASVPPSPTTIHVAQVEVVGGTNTVTMARFALDALEEHSEVTKPEDVLAFFRGCSARTTALKRVAPLLGR